MAIGYKILSVPDNSEDFYSYNGLFDGIKYTIGDIIKAPDNTRLFIFDSLENCKQLFDSYCGDRLFTCEYFGGIKYNGAFWKSERELFWKWFNETLAKKKGFKNAKCPVQTNFDLTGTVLVKQLRLIEDVTHVIA